MSRSRAIALLAAVGIALAVLSYVTQVRVVNVDAVAFSQSPTAAESKPGVDYSPLPLDPELARQAERLVALTKAEQLVKDNPDLYAGFDAPSSSQASIYVVGNLPASMVDAAQKSVLGVRANLEEKDIKVTITNLKYSLRQLSQIQQDYYAKSVFGARDQTLGYESEIKPALNKVQFRVPEGDVAWVAAIASKLYGDKVEVVKKVYFEHEQAGRYSDTSPFYGGIRTRGPRSYVGVGCTLGFTLTNLNGKIYGTTAGHCYPKTSAIFNGNFQDTANGLQLGFVQFNKYQERISDLDNALIDPAAIGANFAGRIFVGSVSSVKALSVHGTANSCTDCKVLLSGSYTGESLLTLNGEKDFCFETSVGMSCHLVRTTPGSCTDGDSGGPIWANDGRGGVTAVGLHTIGGPYSCSYTPFPQILQFWQSTITTQ